MVAGIAEIQGKAAMAGNVLNGLWWHGLGTQLQGQVTGDEILTAASLDWDVVKTPLFTYPVSGPNLTSLIPVGGKMAAMRDIDSKVLGIVGETYQVIQNREIAEFADALLKVSGGVRFESAGALYDGKVVWLLASLPEKAFHVDGDNGEIMPYLLLRTGHDGLTKFSLVPTPVRVVCQNTLSMALAGAKAQYDIRHTINALDKVAQARSALGINIEFLDTLKAVSTELVKRPMTIKDVIKATEKLIPSVAEDETRASRAILARESIRAIYLNTENLQSVPESAYRFVQAVAQYADHVRVYRKTKKGEAESARAVAIVDGQGRDLKERALTLVLPQAAKRGPKGQFVKA